MDKAATLQINEAEKMTPQRRQEIADWLRMHADDLVKDGDEYADNFHGTFYNR